MYQSYTHANIAYHIIVHIAYVTIATCTEIDPQWTSYINPCESKHAYMTLAGY